MQPNKFVKQYIPFLLLLVLIACTPRDFAIPTATPTLPHSMLVIDTSKPDHSMNKPLFIPLQPTPTDIIGGGTVEDGPFLFDLRLFRDSSFNQHPVASSLYSEMNGIGSFMYWCYQGNKPSGPIETYWGTLPQLDQLLQETYASVQPGSCGGRTGGIMLPGGLFLSGESKVGDRIQVALKVKTADGEFGATISFTLAQGSNGFEPIDISVKPLQ